MPDGVTITDSSAKAPRMFRNLLALLFLFALALPALAVPAPVDRDAPVMAEDCHGIPTGQDRKVPAGEHAMQHGCIGCIAPYVAAIELTRAARPIAPPLPGPMAALAGFAPKPHAPPPRNGL